MTDKMERWIYAGLLVAVFLILGLTFLLHPWRINTDNAMLLELGNFLLEGRQPYVDYYETNPPLIHYLNIIPAALARLTGMNLISMFLLLVIALTMWSALSIRHLLQRHLPQPDPLSVTLIPIALVLAGLYVNSINNHGQREHLFVLLFMPYFVLRWLRWQGLAENVWIGTAIGLGILAGIGACIKPHFLLAAALPELYWLVKHRRLNGLWQPEILSFGATGLLYGIHFLLLPPESKAGFFDFIVPEMLKGYSAYGALPARAFLKKPHLTRLAVLALPFILLPIRRRQGVIWHLAQPMALFGLASFATFVYQAKAWNYQRVPFDMAVMMTAALLIFTTRLSKPREIQPGYSARRVQLGFVLVVVFTVLISMDNLSFYPLAGEDVTMQHIVTTHTAENDAILTIDTNMAPSFPILMQHNRRSIGSFPQDFPLAIGMRGLTETAFYDPAIELPATIQFYLAIVQDDVETYEPDVIIIRQGHCPFCPPGFDIVRFLEARGFVEKVIEPDYRRVEDLPYDEFAVWLREPAQ
ncbi:hypothetical protein ACFLYO_07870 [Chloroflexota bacterium]